MAVFTVLTRQDVSGLLDQYSLGALVDFQGIAAGIENSNFFLTTERGEYVLTVFERLSFEQLPFYLGLMRHLAQRDLPVPLPQTLRDGSLLCRLRDKPVAIVSRLPGRWLPAPVERQCEVLGGLLARMHLAAHDYAAFQPNLRGIGWWKEALPRLEPHLPATLFHPLAAEVIHQDSFFRHPDFEQLPAGAVHADLFRDNVLWVDSERVGGVIDFYFAGCTLWLYDLAVTVNDWCTDLETGAFDRPRARALLRAYHRLRPLTELEHQSWPTVLRAAALRFWISRLYDWYLPRPAQVLKPHDPARFEQMLRQRIADPEPPWVD